MLTITDKAASALANMMPSDYTGLRIRVQGGGCSGMQYALAFDHYNDNDKVVMKDSISCIIDSKSALYLLGSTLDYKEGLTGAGFVIDNPNVNSKCGCGSSFNV